MKKSLVVLLIAVLALSAVFAEPAMTVDGSVTAKYVVDLDKGTASYTAPAVNANLAWKLEQPIAKVGSAKAYIDAAATFTFALDKDFSAKESYPLASTIKAKLDKFAIVGEDWTVDFLASVGNLDYAVSAIDTAKYAPTDADGYVTGAPVKSGLTYLWYVNQYDDAVSIKKDGIGTLTVDGGMKAIATSTPVYSIENLSAAPEDAKDGSVTYKVWKLTDGGFATAAGYTTEGCYLVKETTTEVADKTPVLSVEFESDEYALSDAVKAQFGFGYAYADKFGFSGKFAYEDVFKVAGDFGYDNGLSYDITTSFKYDILTVDTYFADGFMCIWTPADLYGASDDDYLDYKFNVEKLFSVKAAVDVKEISTVFTVTAKDIFNENDDPNNAKMGRTFDFVAANTSFDNYTFTTEVKTTAANELSNEAGITYVGFTAAADYAEELGVKADVTVMGFGEANELKPYVTASLTYAKNGFESYYFFTTYPEALKAFKVGAPYGFTAKTSYTGKVVKLSAAAYYNTYAKPYIAEVQGYKTEEGLWLAAGIESDKLVDGALLSLSYASQKDEEAAGYKFANGKITAACKVTF